MQEPRIICLKELLLHLKQIVLQALGLCFVINLNFLCLALFCFGEQHPLIVFSSRDVWIIIVFKAGGFVWLSINSCMNLHTSKLRQRKTGRWDRKEKMRRADERRKREKIETFCLSHCSSSTSICDFFKELEILVLQKNLGRSSYVADNFVDPHPASLCLPHLATPRGKHRSRVLQSQLSLSCCLIKCGNSLRYWFNIKKTTKFFTGAFLPLSYQAKQQSGDWGEEIYLYPSQHKDSVWPLLFCPFPRNSLTGWS